MSMVVKNMVRISSPFLFDPTLGMLHMIRVAYKSSSNKLKLTQTQLMTYTSRIERVEDITTRLKSQLKLNLNWLVRRFVF
jgi:hypothetical protein